MGASKIEFVFEQIAIWYLGRDSIVFTIYRNDSVENKELKASMNDHDATF